MEGDLYFLAKNDRWELVDEMIDERRDRIVSYVHPFSGWTFLRQAIHHDNPYAVLLLLAHGATVSSEASKAAAGRPKVARLLGHMDRPGVRAAARARVHVESKKNVLPKESCVLVPYAGGVVKVEGGKEFWTDAQGRVLIGWHGTYSPPCGMDGESLVEMRVQ